jgi:hypothetical protein
MRDSLRDGAQVCSASLRIIGSISVNSLSRTNVSSVDRFRVTGYAEIMRRGTEVRPRSLARSSSNPVSRKFPVCDHPRGGQIAASTSDGLARARQHRLRKEFGREGRATPLIPRSLPSS